MYVFVWSFALSKNMWTSNIHSSECCSIFLLYTICFKQLRLLRLLDKQKRMCSSVPRASSCDHCRQLFSLGICSRDAAKLRGLVWLQKKSTQPAPGNTCQDKWTNRRLDWVTCFFQQKSIRQTFHQFLNYVLFWHFFTFAYLCCLLVPPVTWANKSWRKMASECLIEGTSCKNPPSPKSKWWTLPHTPKKI